MCSLGSLCEGIRQSLLAVTRGGTWEGICQNAVLLPCQAAGTLFKLFEKTAQCHALNPPSSACGLRLSFDSTSCIHLHFAIASLT